MMTAEIDPTPGEVARMRSWRGPLIAILVAFLVGLGLMAWLLSHSDRAARTLGVVAASPAPAPAAAPAPMLAPPAALPRVTADPQTVSALDARVADLESRIAHVSERAQLASGDASRAEGLLIAFAARRAIERGLGLGYIEAQLRVRFGATQPQAVSTVIAASRDPLTVEDLELSLDDLGPSLAADTTSGDGWWSSFRRELSGLAIIRKAGSPSPLPSERLRRARRMLEAGRVDAALAEVARMPGREKADGWMQAARRYIATRQALDVLETSAIVEPKTDGPPPLLPEPPRAAPAN
ncbi:MAG: hypothetical protein DI623_01245 [Sphingomonas sanxanigenens]|uniref:Inner membrane protein n=1 Tax=Sphingomonas sanxanigenens TaxID=397260 RepID=A0A2W5AD04_9SPHN|nr:MAG: hypothetical protein DI623_01245 [Sphingomonas sanxanigenens]